jgi:hypothetical protein
MEEVTKGQWGECAKNKEVHSSVAVKQKAPQVPYTFQR